MTQLECEKTNVLISPSVEGEKVTFARRWKVCAGDSHVSVLLICFMFMGHGVD